MQNRHFQLTIHYGRTKSNYLESRDKSETIEANSMVELVSKFAILVAKLDRELHEEDLANLTAKNTGFDDDIPF